MTKLWLLRQCKCIYFVENEVDNVTCLDGNFGPKSRRCRFHVGPKLPGFDRKCVATLSTSINPITQENENCISGPFEVDSTYYKYKMTNTPQMHLVLFSGHGPKLPLRAKVTRNYGTYLSYKN